jgi:nitrogen PTS system EIIA component
LIAIPPAPSIGIKFIFMRHLAELLTAGAVTAGFAVAGKKPLFQHLATVAAREYELDAQIVLERLTERERLGSTGFGNGIAIPHGKIAGLKQIVAVFAHLAQPIDFQAIDDLPVDIVFCLLSPPDAGADHLKALALVSRWLRDPNFVAKLRGAGSSDAAMAIIAGAQVRDAA